MEHLLLLFIAISTAFNILKDIGLTEVILKPFAMYSTSRAMEKVKPYYDRIKAGYEQLDDSLMTDNHLIDFLFEGSDYVWQNIIPSIAKELPPKEQQVIVDHITKNFNGEVFLGKVALKKDVVAKQIN